MKDIFDFIDNLPNDQVRTISAFIFMLPLGWVMNILKGGYIRLMYSLIFGILIQFYIYGISMLHVFIASCINLLILKLVNEKSIGKIATIYNFSHNSLIHLYRLIYEYDNWSIEISVLFMMTICKLSGFVYAYQDGLKYSQGIHITDNQKKYMINNFSLLEFFSYIYFYSTSICGPFIEFQDFKKFINRKEEYEQIPSTILPSIIRQLTGFLFYLLFSILKEVSAAENIIDEEHKFTKLQRFLFYVCGSGFEFKYIGGFCLSESAVIASGFGYDGPENKDTNSSKSNHDKWGKNKSIAILNLQLVYKPTEFFHHWNISTHLYLKRYVYFRLIPQNSDFKQKQLASSQTFFVSAFWHGFHPTYFVVFFHFYFYTLLEQQITNIIRIKKVEIKHPRVYIFFIRFIILTFLVPYHAIMFNCLDYTKLLKFLQTVYAFGTLLILIPNVVLFVYSSIFLRKTTPSSNKDKNN